jgi:hypothetical protein
MLTGPRGGGGGEEEEEEEECMNTRLTGQWRAISLIMGWVCVYVTQIVCER